MYVSINKHSLHHRANSFSALLAMLLLCMIPISLFAEQDQPPVFGAQFFEHDLSDAPRGVESAVKPSSGTSYQYSNVHSAGKSGGAAGNLANANFSFADRWRDVAWEELINIVGYNMFQDTTALFRSFDADEGVETDNFAWLNSWGQGLYPFSNVFTHTMHPAESYFINELAFSYLYKKQVEEYNPPIYADTVLYNFTLDGNHLDSLPYKHEETYQVVYNSGTQEMDTTALPDAELAFFKYDHPGVFDFSNAPEPYWEGEVLNVWPAFNLYDTDSTGEANDTVWVESDSVVYLESFATKHVVGYEQESKPVVDTLVIQFFAEYDGSYVINIVDEEGSEPDTLDRIQFVSPSYDRDAGIAMEDSAVFTLRVPLHEDYLGEDPANWDPTIADPLNNPASGADRIMNIALEQIDSIGPIEIPADMASFPRGTPMFTTFTYLSGKPHVVGDTIHDGNRNDPPFGTQNVFMMIIVRDNGSSFHPDGNFRLSARNAWDFYGPFPPYSSTYAIFGSSNRYHPHSNPVVGDLYVPFGNIYSRTIPVSYNISFSNTPHPITLNMPEDGATGVEYEDNLIWFPEVLVEMENDIYQLQISTDNAFTDIVFNQSVSDTFHVLDGLQDNTTYFWRVRGIVNGNEGDWSDTWSFNTDEFGQPNFIASETSINPIRKIYPNPVRQGETLNLVYGEMETLKIQVYDILGKQLNPGVEYLQSGDENRIQINTSELNPGIYIYKASGSGMQSSGRFTVTH